MPTNLSIISKLQWLYIPNYVLLVLYYNGSMFIYIYIPSYVSLLVPYSGSTVYTILFHHDYIIHVVTVVAVVVSKRIC